MSLRSEQLFGLVDRLNETHKAWVAGPHHEPTPAYWDAVDDVLESFADGEIPAECRSVADAVERLAEANQKHEEQLAKGGGEYPGHSFFAAREQLELARQRQIAQEKPPLESLEELIRQGVGNRQIAEMWGIEIHQVEAFRGGRWKPAEGFLPPSERERLASISAAEMEASARLQAKGSAAAKVDDCPETVEELLRQGVSFKQVAAMKGLSEADVLAVAKTLGIFKGKSGEPVLPDPLSEPPASIESVVEPSAASPPESPNGDGAGEASLEADILALANEGYEPGDIASATGADKRKVNAVLRKHKVEVEAATASV